MRRSVAAIALLLVATGCAGESPKTYDPGRSAASLERVGWVVDPVAPPSTTAGGQRPLAYLETTAPDRRRIDLQFLESPEAATAELAARRRQAPGFGGTTVGNVVVIPAGERTDDVPDADLALLRSRLATS